MILVLVVLAVLIGHAQAQTPSRLSFDSSGHFLIHGQPRFVRGVYDSGIGWYTDPSQWESVLFLPGGDVWGTRNLGSTAINMYLNYQQGQDTLTQVNAAFTALQKYKVMWLQTTNCFTNTSYTAIPFSADQPPAGQFSGQLALNSQMAGYYVMDECSDSSYGAVNLVPETQQHYATLKSYDPQAILMAVPIAAGYRDPKLWTQPASGGPTADLFATDPYPLYNAEPSTGYPHFEVADYIARLRSDVPASKPIAGVLQLFKFTTNARLPTYAEMRMHAYSAIVEGAQGLFWWDIGANGLRNSSDNTSAQVTQWMAYLQSLVNELASLEAALLAPPTPSALVGNSSSTGDPIGWRKTVLQRDMTIVQSLSYSTYEWYQAELNALNAGDTSLSPMLHQASPQSGNIRTRTSIVNGIGYVIAYNYTNLAATATLTWQSPLAQVAVIGEGRSLTPSNASFTDSFAAYGVHVYQVTPTGTPAPPPPAPSPLTASVTNPVNGSTVSGTTTVSVGAAGGTQPYNYKIAVDGTSIYAGTNPSTSWVTTTTTNGSHTVATTVTDSSSPAVAATASIQVTVANNTTAPFSASFSYPASGATVGGSQSVGMATTATWGQAKTFTLTVDGAVITSQSLTGTTLWIEWDTTKVTNGSHTLTLAVTMNGQTATATLPLTVSNGSTPPPPPLTASFTSPAAGATISGTTTVGMSSSGGATGSRTFNLQFSGPTSVAPVTLTTTGTTASFSWDTTKAANGNYTLTLTVTDAAGATATASRTVAVSNSPPPPPAGFTASITYPANGATVGGNQSVGMSTTATWGTAKTFTLSVDGKVLTAIKFTGSTAWYTWNTTGTPNGTHTLKLTVTNSSGTATSSITVAVKN